MIAEYALARRLGPTPPPSDDQRRLTALAEVTADLPVQKQRLHRADDPTAHASRAEAIAFFTCQAKTLAAEIAVLVHANPLRRALDATIRAVKGLADNTVAVVLPDPPELGALSNKPVPSDAAGSVEGATAKLVGLAPPANESGKRRIRRAIRGGRASVRSILYLVADIARNYDSHLAAFRERLLAQGKTKTIVRIPLAGKLLVRLNTKARDTRSLIAANA